MKKLRKYSDLKPKKRYKSDNFFCTLVKKGYHPKNGAHSPTISLMDYNEYLLEAQLASGKFELDGWIYPVISWKFISRIHDDVYDSTRCVYELVLGMDATPVESLQYKPDDEKWYGVCGSKTGNNYRIGGVTARLIKKSPCVTGGNYHTPVVSIPYYNYCYLKTQLNSGVIEFNHMLYLVLDWEDVPRKTTLKKDGTPYVIRNNYISMKLKTPGRRVQQNHERKPNVLDEMFEDVQL